MGTENLIKSYEVLSHAQRINLLNEKGKEITKDSTPEQLMDYYWLWCIAVVCADNLMQLDEMVDKEYSDEYIAACTFVRSVESRESIKDEDRQKLIDWIEKNAVEKRYWETESGSMSTIDFVERHAFVMDSCRKHLVFPFFSYSPMQLKDLRNLNELLIYIGIQVSQKAKLLAERIGNQNNISFEQEIEAHLERSFSKYEGAPYERWTAKQFEQQLIRSWGDGCLNSSGDYIFLAGNKEYLETDPNFYWKWPSGLDSEKIKGIPISFLYHDLWEQKLGVHVTDIIKIKEVEAHVEIKFIYEEGIEVWNE